MRKPEAIMAERRRAQWLWLVVAGAFILAGLRDMFLPGVLSISGRDHGNGVGFLVAGVLVLSMALASRVWREPRQPH
jgi:hypothetical protein